MTVAWEEEGLGHDIKHHQKKSSHGNGTAAPQPHKDPVTVDRKPDQIERSDAYHLDACAEARRKRAGGRRRRRPAQPAGHGCFPRVVPHVPCGGGAGAGVGRRGRVVREDLQRTGAHGGRDEDDAGGGVGEDHRRLRGVGGAERDQGQRQRAPARDEAPFGGACRRRGGQHQRGGRDQGGCVGHEHARRQHHLHGAVGRVVARQPGASAARRGHVHQGRQVGPQVLHGRRVEWQDLGGRGVRTHRSGGGGHRADHGHARDWVRPGDDQRATPRRGD